MNGLLKKKRKKKKKGLPDPSPPPPPSEKRGRASEKERKASAEESRAVSLQKGTNQPATRMSLNRSQRSCRSTKYGTQAKT